MAGVTGQITESIKDPATIISLAGSVGTIIAFTHLMTKLNELTRQVELLSKHTAETSDQLAELEERINSDQAGVLERIRTLHKDSKRKTKEQAASLRMVCEDLQTVSGAVSDLGKEVKLKVGVLNDVVQMAANTSNSSRRERGRERDIMDSSDEEGIDLSEIRRQTRKKRAAARGRVGV